MAMTGQNFEMWQGEDEQIDVPVTDGSSPVNLSGAGVIWKVFDGETLLFSKTESGGIVIGNSGAVGDLLTISIAKADTANVAPGFYEHECRVSKGGTDQVIFVGTMTLHRSRTLV